jgi:allantoin racemase
VAVDDDGIGLTHVGLSIKDIPSLIRSNFYRTIPIMSRILIINPNTTASITALLQEHAKKTVSAEVHVEAVTARFGAPYIACEVSYAVASHAVLDAWTHAISEADITFDSVLIGCFGDPGLLALREANSVPVTGLAEASFIEAAKYGRFAIVTGGERWKPILERLASTLGYREVLAGITTVAPSGAELTQDPIGAQALLTKACRRAAKDFQAHAVILGGAGLAGMAARVQAEVDVPVIDSVLAGVRHAAYLANQPKLTNSDGSNRRLNEILTWLGKF